jgi:phosphoribosylglycinamide formyltransferase-1
MLRIGFLASNNGSSMRAIVNAMAEGRLSGEPCIVISNNAGAPALAFARERGIKTAHISQAKLGEGADVDAAIRDALAGASAEWVVLSGYMRRIGPKTLARFPNRILNIHPAMLPRHGGPGMYGAHVHRSVLNSGDRTSGITIHVVDDEYDQGPVVAQRKVMLVPNDTPESLAARVQEQEPEFFIETLKRIDEGKIVIPGEHDRA